MVRTCQGAALARRARRQVVGRISAQVDELVQEHMGQGIGQWGFFDALDGEASAALIAAAEDWLRQQGMTSALGPISLSIWMSRGSRSKASTSRRR